MEFFYVLFIAYNYNICKQNKKAFASDGDLSYSSYTKGMSKGLFYSEGKPEKKNKFNASNRLVLKQRGYKQTGDGNYVEVESYDISG